MRQFRTGVARTLEESASAERAAYTITPVPLRWRLIKAVAPLTAGFVVSWGLWNESGPWSAIAFSAVALWVSWKLLTETEVKRLTTIDGKLSGAARAEVERTRMMEEAATAAKNARESEQAARWEKLGDLWWVRYPVAALCVSGSIAISNSKPDAWWIAIAGLFAAAMFARELSILLLVIGGFCLVYIGVAALPASVAIVVGALVIAAGLRK